MILKKLCEKVERHIEDRLSAVGNAFDSREDSRAFGGMIEKAIADKWAGICASMRGTALPEPGKRTIYDVALKTTGRGSLLVGVDIRTRDLDEKKYSDGGVCSVKNLLQFMVRQHGLLLVAEVGHSVSKQSTKHRVIDYVRVAPLQCLPKASYRIENLGTGQIRLNQSISGCYNGINWDRSNHQFYEILCPLAIDHYRKVIQTSTGRVKAIKAFVAGNYDNISLK
jgi:hypothetical protein